MDWMSPEEVYLHRESTSSQLYRGISASLGFRKPVGKLLTNVLAQTDILALTDID